MQLFTLAFWANALEHALVAGASALAGTQIFTGGTITAQTWEAAGITAGMAALYAFIKQLGGVQLANGVLKIGGARHAAAAGSRSKAAE